MKRIRIAILKIVLIIALGVLFLFAYYLECNKDINRVLDLLKSVTLIVVPVFAFCEVIFLKIVNSKIESDYKVNVFKNKIIDYYGNIEKSSTFLQYIDTYLYLIKRGELLSRINYYIEAPYKRIAFIAEINDVVSQRNSILKKYKKSNVGKNELKHFLNRLEDFNFEEYSSWFVKEMKEYKTKELFRGYSKTTFDIIAIVISTISLIISIAGLLNFELTWWHLFYFVLPLAVEITSFFTSPKSFVKLEQEILENHWNELKHIDRLFHEQYDDACKIKEYERLVSIDIKSKSKKQQFQ